MHSLEYLTTLKECQDAEARQALLISINSSEFWSRFDIYRFKLQITGEAGLLSETRALTAFLNEEIDLTGYP